MQWKEMDDSGKQTDKIIAADERLATAMENSVAQAGKALDATIEQNNLDQRAWVGVNSIVKPPGSTDSVIFVHPDVQPDFAVVIRNTGRTPALRVSHQMGWRTLFSKDRFIPLYGKQIDNNRSAMQPGQDITLTTGIDSATPKISAAMIEAIRNGQLMLYLYGRISYQDIFGKSHNATFCVFLAKTLNGFGGCSTYNDAD